MTRSIFSIALVFSLLLPLPLTARALQEAKPTTTPTKPEKKPEDPTNPKKSEPENPTEPAPVKTGRESNGSNVPRTSGNVIVSIGKPSIWTLAQAHYLLAQLHNTNSQLQVAELAPLDPNSINRNRIEVLRTMMGITGEYNQLTGLKNDLTRQRYETNVARQRDVRSLTDQRRNDLYQVIRELTLLQSELGKLQTAKDPDKDLIKAKEDEKQAKEAERDILKEQIAALNAEATALSADSGTAIPNFAGVSDGSTVQSTPPTSPLASLVDKTTIDNLLKEASKGSSQLDASRRLDNYIQMQYELIAKQLTLLRDEVGKDERIVFLELPSSVYTVPKRSDRRIVQIRWEVAEYLNTPESTSSTTGVTTRCLPREVTPPGINSPPSVELSSSVTALADKLPVRTTKLGTQALANDAVDAMLQPVMPVTPTQAPKAPSDLQVWPWSDEKKTLITVYWADESAREKEGFAKEFIILRKAAGEAADSVIGTLAASQTQFVDLTVNPGTEYSYTIRAKNDKGHSDSKPVKKAALPIKTWVPVDQSQRQVRAVDIIPRQSALNVNETHDTSNGWNIAAKLSAFAGFGGKVDYQRQREVYDQFVYQDVFASGYGKGENRFGWTFGALPGSKRIAPGVRTTYAVLVVPATAKKLKLKAWGYAFDQSKPIPEWKNTTAAADETFELEIPGSQTDSFEISAVEYIPVKSGERTTLVLRGQYFSPQVGILINGVPLRKVVSIARSSTTANNASERVGGEFEYVGSNKIVATFTMGPNYEGTPVITLVTPEKATIINSIDLSVNNAPLSCNSIERNSILEPMFSPPLALERAQLIDIIKKDNELYAVVSLFGKGFKRNPVITVNGKLIRIESEKPFGPDETEGTIQQNSTRQLVVTFLKPKETSWEFSLTQKNGQLPDETTLPLRMAKPLTRQVNYEILRYRLKTPKTPAELAVKLDVSDFKGTPKIQIVDADGPKDLPGKAIPLSPGELLVTVQSPEDLRLEPIILLLTEEQTGALVSIVPPVPPTINAIVNSAAENKPEGSTEGEYPVTIQGENLEYVARVYFDSTPARILQTAPSALTVMVPPRAADGAVQIRLETNIKFMDRLLTNVGDFSTPNKARFTYVKPKTDNKADNKQPTRQ